MPSPFPGMDPYIETWGHWGDFHLNMLSAMRGQLNARLPRRYTAENDEYVWVLETRPARRRRGIEPDIYVAETGRRGGAKGGATAVADLETLVMAPAERRRHRYLRVIDREENRVVTAVELLSPSNKYAGDDHEAYLAKRREYFGGRVNLVEVDLLRGGPRLPLSDPPPEYADYCAAVFRSWEYPRFGFRTFTLRDPLREIPVPLAPGVADVLLPPRPCLDRVYDEGGYGRKLPYDDPLSPRVSRADAAWIRGILAGRPSENPA